MKTQPLFLTLALALGTSQLQAKPVTVEYTAQVKWMSDAWGFISSSNAPGYNVSVGETVTGTFSYDTDTQMENWGSSFYYLYDNFSQSFKFANGDRISLNGTYVQMYEVPETQRIHAEAVDSAAVNYHLRVDVERFGEDINSHGYLPEPELWSQFNGNNYIEMWYHLPGTTIHMDVGADITSFRVLTAVPEPSTYLMLGAGLGLLGLARRNRSNFPARDLHGCKRLA